MKSFTFLGMISEFDPPKSSAYKAVIQLKQSGHKMIVITGDERDSTADLLGKIGVISEPQLEYNQILKDNPELTKE